MVAEKLWQIGTQNMFGAVNISRLSIYARENKRLPNKDELISNRQIRILVTPYQINERLNSLLFTS